MIKVHNEPLKFIEKYYYYRIYAHICTKNVLKLQRPITLQQK